MDKSTICRNALGQLTAQYGDATGRPLTADEIAVIAPNPTAWTQKVPAEIVEIYGESIGYIISRIRKGQDPLEGMPAPAAAAGRHAAPQEPAAPDQGPGPGDSDDAPAMPMPSRPGRKSAAGVFAKSGEQGRQASGPGRSPEPPAPVEQAAPPEPPQNRNPSALPLSAEDFAPYDFLDEVTVPVGRLSFGPAAGGGTRMRWPEWSGEDDTVIYRLIERTDLAPYSPDEAILVAATTDTEFIDDTEPSSAVRFLQVWANVGRTPEDARNNQPVKIAQGDLVNTVADIHVRDDSGSVVGQWRTWPGTERVDVYRIPLEKAGTVSPVNPAAAIEYRICPGENLRGFVDSGAERGKRYQYRFYTQVSVGDQTLQSRMEKVDIETSTVLEPVDDLEITLEESDTGPRFTLTWTTPPAGEVEIYRSDSGPSAGAEDEVSSRGQLGSVRLGDDARLGYPIESLGDGRETMRDIPWPDDWDRTFFTPVTSFGDKVKIGTSINKVRVEGMGSARLVDRIDRQVVSFQWPRSAIEVEARVGPPGASPEQVTGTPWATVTQEQYTVNGGLVFDRQLPHEGCSVALTPITFSEGHRVPGTPVSLEYSPILRVRYRCEHKRSLTGSLKSLLVNLLAEVDTDYALRFVVVHNTDHLPLNRFDGETLSVTVDGDETSPTTREIQTQRIGPQLYHPGWRVNVEGLQGFVRVFVNGETAFRVAVLDPIVDSLVLQSR